MTRSVRILTLLFPFCVTAGAWAESPSPVAPPRNELRDVAVVDLGRVYEHFARLENLASRLADKAQASGADLGKRVKRLVQLEAQARQFRNNLGAHPDGADLSRLTSMDEELRFLQEELSTTEREKFRDIKDRELIWSREILRAAHEQIRRIATTEKLQMVLDKGDWMIHLVPRVDLTDRIIRNMERDRSALRFQ